jgi:hypothetical protein
MERFKKVSEYLGFLAEQYMLNPQTIPLELHLESMKPKWFISIESKLADLDLIKESQLIDERKSKLSSEMRKIVKYVIKTKKI